MLYKHTLVVSHKECAAMAYASPQLTRLGNIRDVTSASGQPGDPGLKGNQTAENAPGVGTLRKP